MSALTLFRGDQTDCFPCGAADLDWQQMQAAYQAFALEAPGTTKASKGYAIFARLRPSTDADIATIEAGRQRKWPDWLMTEAQQNAARQFGYRNADHLTEVTAIGIDYDECPQDSPNWAPGAWPCEVFAHSSHNFHPETAPGKWRAVLRLDSPIPPGEYNRVKAAIQKLLPPGCFVRAPHQPAFLPTCPAGAVVHFAHVAGAPLDWKSLAETVPRKATRAQTLPTDRTPMGPLPAGLVAALAERWPEMDSGLCYKAMLALGGVLAESFWNEDDIEDFACAVFEAAGVDDKSYDVARSAENRRLDPAIPVYGWPKLKEALRGSKEEVDALLTRMREEIPGMQPPKFDIEAIAKLQTKAELTATKVQFAQDVAKAEGRRMLGRGTQLEVAEGVIDEHLKGCAYAEGEVWRPNANKVWEVVDRFALELFINKWDGTEYLTPKGDPACWKADAGPTKGVIDKIRTLLCQEDFFNNAPVGAAFKGDVFVGLKGPEPLTLNHRIRYCCPWTFDPKTPPLSTLKTMRQWFAGCADTDDRILCLLEQTGVSLLGAGHLPGFDKALMLTGEGANGKSVNLAIMQSVLPPGSYSSVAPQNLGDEQSISNLAGMRANIATEISESVIMSSGTLKKMISHERVEAKVVFKPKFFFIPTCTYTFAANALPPTDDYSRGFWRRWVVIHFPHTFQGAAAEVGLLDRLLKTEAGAIASFSVAAGLAAIQRGGLTVPASSHDALKAWQQEADQVATFVEDLEIEALPAAMPQVDWFPTATLYEKYHKWAEDGGARPLMKKSLIKRLGKLGFIQAKPRGKARVVNVSVGGPVLAAVTSKWGAG